MALFKDMLKKWFYTTGTNPTLSNISRIPILDSSGDPVGSQTVNTMAYCIADRIGHGQITNGSSVLSDDIGCGTYLVDETAIDLPSDFPAGYAIMEKFNSNIGGNNFFIRLTHRSTIKIWMCFKTSAGWGSWRLFVG
ncbi:MAG: hypothetical protein IJT48_07690 [Bacteroidaceae bacterium]|nr:hypothetical protein [Bacteroidaceae bacterium]